MANDPKKAPATTASAPATAPAKVKKARPAVDPRETPDARFMRIGRKRVTVAVRAIARVAQLGKSKARKTETGDWRRNQDGTTSGYAYTAEQAEKLIQYMTNAVAEAKTALAPRQAMKAGQELLEL